MKQRILVIEDEAAINLAVRDELEFEGFDVTVAEDGAAGLKAILESGPDLVVLDLMLPLVSGFEVCREVRRRGLATPIIMLTARTQEVDRVRGLDLGADDYVVKPFGLAELVARICAVLRRSGAREAGDDSGELHGPGGLGMDLKRHLVCKHGREIKLTYKEFKLLELLLRSPGKVISRDDFLDQVWGEGGVRHPPHGGHSHRCPAQEDRGQPRGTGVHPLCQGRGLQAPRRGHRFLTGSSSS